MRLIITRHGKTIQNESGVIQGRTPGELNERGHQEARLLGERLANENIESIYCSPSNRCKETLEDVLGWFDIKPKTAFVEALQEREFGELTGLPLLPLHYELLENNSEESRKMGIESVDELFQRTKDFIVKIKKTDSEKTVLIVTHSNNVRAMLMYFLNKSFTEILDYATIKNCAYTEFDIDSDGGVKEIVVDDVAHLSEIN